MPANFAPLFFPNQFELKQYAPLREKLAAFPNQELSLKQLRGLEDELPTNLVEILKQDKPKKIIVAPPGLFDVCVKWAGNRKYPAISSVPFNFNNIKDFSEIWGRGKTSEDHSDPNAGTKSESTYAGSKKGARKGEIGSSSNRLSAEEEKKQKEKEEQKLREEMAKNVQSLLIVADVIDCFINGKLEFHLDTTVTLELGSECAQKLAKMLSSADLAMMAYGIVSAMTNIDFYAKLIFLAICLTAFVASRQITSADKGNGVVITFLAALGMCWTSSR